METFWNYSMVNFHTVGLPLAILALAQIWVILIEFGIFYTGGPPFPVGSYSWLTLPHVNSYPARACAEALDEFYGVIEPKTHFLVLNWYK